MRTERERLARAADKERRARACDTPEASTDFLYMARGRRRVARQAAWQDPFRADPISI